jgi:hypothetical protein
MARRKAKFSGKQIGRVGSLTAVLAQRVMGWHVAPERFIIEGRRWMPAWRFQPLERLQDAIRLLEAADPDEYCIHKRRDSEFSVRVQLSGSSGEASEPSEPRAITFAIARAFGFEPEGGESIQTGAKGR